MLEIIKFIINQFAEKPDQIEYKVEEVGKDVNVTVILEESDMGKVIGRQGKIAKAIRTIVRAVSSKENKKYNLEIKERGEI